MGKVESLIGSLRAEATLDSVGHLSLDESKAREKLGDFLLTDPSAYVLELVQASLLLGAEEPGLSRALRDAADVRLRIPMAPGVDSLNL